MAATPPRYTPEQREQALAIFEQHGPAEAGRRTGIPRGTISSWAKREGRKSPNSDRMQVARKAAQEWNLRRVRLRDMSGQAAEEFLAEARERVKSAPRAVADLMRAYSIAITAANTLAAQTAGESVTSGSEKIDDEVEQMLGAIRAEAREQVLQEIRDGAGVAETPGPNSGPPAEEPLGTEEAEDGEKATDLRERQCEDTWEPQREPTAGERELDTRIRYGEFVA